ncbi:hypothetical protein FNT36_03160 [Hymenobacter setariae]|uniref:Uncharacterized protein n=1 Tax=Hymenobacter setariae TaxID=2594794 RepID=A0A558C2S7_9BACT|nr:hypothetical protein [Hymenobacter setariae]TVT43105.1 hypothetical protein FNT36_03160 [Hymenobacter setariae]
MPDLRLLFPPALGETTATLAEGPDRQVWHRCQLDAHQLDYFCHEDLHPGWRCWTHEGRYLSDASLRYLVGQMWPGYGPPD